MPVLGSLLAGLSLPVDEPTLGDVDSHHRETVPATDLNVHPAVRPCSPWTSTQFMPLIHRIKVATELWDLLDAMNELDDVSKRKVEVLSRLTVITSLSEFPR